MPLIRSDQKVFNMGARLTDVFSIIFNREQEEGKPNNEYRKTDS